MKKSLCIVFAFSLIFTSCKKDNQQQPETEHVKGLSDDIPPIYFLLPTAHIPLAGGPLPATFELDMPPSGDQGHQGSCVGWSVGYGLKSYQRKHEFNLNYGLSGNLDSSTVCSPSYIYNQIKLNDCYPGGAYITDAMQVLVNKGVCTLKEMPYDHNVCSASPNTFQNTQATANKAATWATLPINVDDIKNAVYSGLPVVIGVKVDHYLDQPTALTPAGEYIWNNTGPLLGRHAIVIYGYDDNIGAFKLFNSWGTNWGNNGSIWMAYSILSAVCNEAYVAYNDLGGGNVNGPKISVPSSLDFGNVAIGSPQSQNLIISNPGNAALTVSAITSTDPSHFSVSNSGFTVPANGGTHAVSISFNPTAVNVYSATLVINSDAVSGQGVVQLSGTGTNGSLNGAYIQVTPGVVNFSNVQIYTSQTQTVVVKNIGNATLTVTDTTWSTTHIGFNVYPSNFTLVPNQEQNVVITFSPSASGTYTTVLGFESNAINGNGEVNVSGSAIGGGGSSCGSFTDTRDGHVYNVVTIGTQCWIAENLNYDVPNQYNDVCYNNDASNCSQYGRLYTWDEAMQSATQTNANPSGVQGVCPTGFHVASYSEWMQLLGNFPGTSQAYLQLYTGGGTGFNAQLGGTYFAPSGGGTDLFYDQGTYGYYLTSTLDGNGDVKCIQFAPWQDVITTNTRTQEYLFSCRCVKNP